MYGDKLYAVRDVRNGALMGPYEKAKTAAGVATLKNNNWERYFKEFSDTFPNGPYEVVVTTIEWTKYD